MSKILGRVLLVAWGASACERHVSIKFPDTSPGQQYQCAVTDPPTRCSAPRTDIEPADDNRGGTVFSIAPDCRPEQRFNEIIIHDAGSSHPTLVFKCAAPDPKIE